MDRLTTALRGLLGNQQCLFRKFLERLNVTRDSIRCELIQFYERFVKSTTNALSVIRSITTRFGPVDDQYESAESSCQAESKKITPKYLKNTRNENMALSQTSGRIQQLSIEQCV